MFLFPSNLFFFSSIDSPWPLPVEPRKTRSDVKISAPIQFMPWNWSFSLPKKNRFEQVPGSSRRQKKLTNSILKSPWMCLQFYIFQISNHLGAAHVFPLKAATQLECSGISQGHSWVNTNKKLLIVLNPANQLSHFLVIWKIYSEKSIFRLMC